MLDLLLVVQLPMNPDGEFHAYGAAIKESLSFSRDYKLCGYVGCWEDGRIILIAAGVIIWWFIMDKYNPNITAM